MVLVILLQDTTPQTKDNQNHQWMIIIKEKEQSDDPSGSGNSSPNTDPTNSR
ncbi:hypothetical protein HYD91_02335 [Mycoplasmopsis bovis]|nr:hypothetical protein [Mycoplasmopsis bovis]QQH35678.1 hypothetical protein HYD91_02335 [Mycoplasmopsis bovis]